MNCELAHERIVTAAYAELADEQTHDLERHMAGCAECAGEREQLLALKVLAGAHPVLEPDANLIARSRQKLEEALDALPPRRWYQRLSQRMRNNLASLRAAPVAVALLLMAAAGAGALGGVHFAQSRAVRTAAAQAATQTALAAQDGQAQAAAATAQTVSFAPATVAAPAEIANISSIVRQPNSRMVEVSYNRLVPQRIQGALDDPAIRQLLMLASQNATSTGVRDNSVGLLAAECRAEDGCQQTGIRDALMVALRNDRNAGVREKALEGLEPYVAQDVEVRNTVLEALMYDSDPRIRTAAINILEPVEADTSVRQVLYAVSNSDQNPHIRTVSREVLDSVPQIQ